MPVERSTGCGHKRVRVPGRDGNPAHGASKDEDSVREERCRPEDCTERSVVRGEDPGPSRQGTDHRRGAAPAVGREATGPGDHAQGCK